MEQPTGCFRIEHLLPIETGVPARPPGRWAQIRLDLPEITARCAFRHVYC